jgi:putative oxidoreductase
MQFFKCLFSILGRVALCTVFLSSALMTKIPNFDAVANYMKDHGVPNERLMLAGAIGFLVIGSLCVVLGFWARFGAFLLAVFLVLATYYFHNFWTLPADGPDRLPQQIHFMKNLAMLGAMLFIMGNGPGAGSIDGGCCKKCPNCANAEDETGSRPNA